MPYLPMVSTTLSVGVGHSSARRVHQVDDFVRVSVGTGVRKSNNPSIGPVWVVFVPQ